MMKRGQPLFISSCRFPLPRQSSDVRSTPWCRAASPWLRGPRSGEFRNAGRRAEDTAIWRVGLERRDGFLSVALLLTQGVRRLQPGAQSQPPPVFANQVSSARGHTRPSMGFLLPHSHDERSRVVCVEPEIRLSVWPFPKQVCRPPGLDTSLRSPRPHVPTSEERRCEGPADNQSRKHVICLLSRDFSATDLAVNQQQTLFW